MCGSCSTNRGRRGKLIDYGWESQRERGLILERWDGLMWTGLVWLKIGTGGDLL
jgi:hypothetical protein